MILLGSCSGSGDDKKLSASGTIEATEVTVSAKVGGEIIRLLVDEGANVHKGDTLAIIDRADLEIQLKEALANAAAADAQHKMMVRGSREEDVLQAEANLKNAEEDLRRAEQLFRERSITEKQLDDTRTRYVVTQQAYEKLKRGFREEEVEAARARRDAAIAQVEAIRKKIADSYVLAPIEGVVTEKSVEEGDVVLPNGTLFRISRLDRVHLTIYVSVVEMAKIKLGQQAKVYIDAFPNQPFLGKVVYISSVAEFTPKNVQTKEDRTKLVFGVKIEISNPEQVLKPGMPADAVLEVTESAAR